MSLVDELVALGHLGGPDTMATLTSRWRSATRQFYVLEPSGGWTDESREDLLHEFLSEKLEDLTDAVVAVRDDEVAVVKVASRIMKNWLIDQARKTDAGAIRVRLEELLGEHEMFIRPAGQGHRWALVGAETDSGVDLDSLVAAAVAVRDVRAVRWSDDTRRAPMASGTDLVRVLEAVLQRAGGSVEIGTLVAVFRRRFAVTMASLVPLEADDTLPDRLAAPIELRAADAAEASNRAAQVYAQLSGRERRILLHLDDHHAVQDLLGVGRSVAYTLIGRVKNVLRGLAGEDVEPAEVAAELVRLAQADPANSIPGAPTPNDDTVATSEPCATTDATGGQQ
jgi:hypothetical protein